jgi:hypothetical protein
MNHNRLNEQLVESNVMTDSFDLAAAEYERLDWRLGGKPPTERALGRQEGVNRRIRNEITDRLLEIADKEVKSE